jgi:outer membrane lipoprotein SlyB
MHRLSFPLRREARPGARALVAAVLAAAALSLAACAEPVTTVTHIEDAPGAPNYYSRAEYGTVRQIDVVDQSAQSTGGGAVLGGLLGGVLGNQIGHGAGRGAATVLGVFGGALLGNHIEQNEAAAASQRYYHVVVEFDGGVTRTFDYRELNGLRVGERVRLDRGTLDRA